MAILEVVMTKFQNLILFIALALWHGTPFRLWSRAWREVEAAHLAEVRKTVWELKCQGRVQEDKEGRLKISQSGRKDEQ